MVPTLPKLILFTANHHSLTPLYVQTISIYFLSFYLSQLVSFLHRLIYILILYSIFSAIILHIDLNIFSLLSFYSSNTLIVCILILSITKLNILVFIFLTIGKPPLPSVPKNVCKIVYISQNHKLFSCHHWKLIPQILLFLQY